MYPVVKRILDFVCSLLGVILLSPLLLVLALLVKCGSPGPVLFRQKRVGKNKTYFEILKFRSMRADTPKDVPTHLLQNAESAITPVGRFLRKTSLDELPQLFNILAGQMSIVGPRPALWNQDDLIAERDRYGVNALTPGLTGWAQVNGRDELPIPVKAELDGYYAVHISFWLDVKIFFRTISNVLFGRGIVEGKH
ncbi:sugar transferase [Anaerofilum sp. BX8]|uniref:Sugar transferase n=1 Tax=Anaerofilum hominis TaxID=2763016 RepID=A0A923L1I4_9FIRM|nr:sugar transferase [Anaerofilum hominis]MBC5582097.1 sugar transferase [Anaerofilum hominis]